jgi:hypothetical protein
MVQRRFGYGGFHHYRECDDKHNREHRRMQRSRNRDARRQQPIGDAAPQKRVVGFEEHDVLKAGAIASFSLPSTPRFFPIGANRIRDASNQIASLL